jgi:DNA-directed RNA polymerase subunit RPC12/RpoP
MKRYVCYRCRRSWFSAANPKDLKARECGNCGGKLVMAEGFEYDHVKGPDFDFTSNHTHDYEEDDDERH